MEKKPSSEFRSNATLSGLFAGVESEPPVSGMQSRLLALYPAGRRLRVWHGATGWRDGTVVSAEAEGTSVRVTVQTFVGLLSVLPADLKEAEEATA